MAGQQHLERDGFPEWIQGSTRWDEMRITRDWCLHSLQHVTMLLLAFITMLSLSAWPEMPANPSLTGFAKSLPAAPHRRQAPKDRSHDRMWIKSLEKIAGKWKIVVPQVSRKGKNWTNKGIYLYNIYIYPSVTKHACHKACPHLKQLCLGWCDALC